MNLNQLSHKWSSKIILIIDKITIEEEFKVVDTDEDGKVTLEEGLKVYEYLRETVETSVRKCVYACCIRIRVFISQTCNRFISKYPN